MGFPYCHVFYYIIYLYWWLNIYYRNQQKLSVYVIMCIGPLNGENIMAMNVGDGRHYFKTMSSPYRMAMIFLFM